MNKLFKEFLTYTFLLPFVLIGYGYSAKAADYDGDGKSDFAVWRPGNGTWFIVQSSNGVHVERKWGLPGDLPVPADYDGDGKSDFAVRRPSNGTWYIIESSNGVHVERQWGIPGDIPVPGR